MDGTIFGREPALIIALVGAALALAASFGLNLTQEQTAAVMGVTIALCAIITRQVVSSPATVAKLYRMK